MVGSTRTLVRPVMYSVRPSMPPKAQLDAGSGSITRPRGLPWASKTRMALTEGITAQTLPMESMAIPSAPVMRFGSSRMASDANTRPVPSFPGPSTGYAQMTGLP